MKKESTRQIVHISGLFFIILAQFIGSYISFIFFPIAIFLTIWSWYIGHIKIKTENIITKLETGFRDVILNMERKNSIPLSGAIWYYIGCGITFLFFSVPIASAACIILSIADALSTIIGKSIGKRKLLGDKTFEGSFVFFFSALFVALLFVDFETALLGALAATIIELLIDTKIFGDIVKRGILNDNLLIPIISALVMTTTFMFCLI